MIFFPGGGVVMHIAAVILLMEEILHHLGIRKALQILGKNCQPQLVQEFFHH